MLTFRRDPIVRRSALAFRCRLVNGSFYRSCCPPVPKEITILANAVPRLESRSTACPSNHVDRFAIKLLLDRYDRSVGINDQMGTDRGKRMSKQNE